MTAEAATPPALHADGSHAGRLWRVRFMQTCHGQIYNSFRGIRAPACAQCGKRAAPVYPAFLPGRGSARKNLPSAPRRTRQRLFELQGIQGQWVEANVGCEACHGPAKRPCAEPSGVKPSLDEARAACGRCHISGQKVDGIEQADHIISVGWRSYQSLPGVGRVAGKPPQR